jgi:hypothetical protein
MDGFSREFSISSVADVTKSKHHAYFAASVDADANSFDVLDELQLLWMENGHLVDNSGPLEACDRTVIVGATSLIAGSDVIAIDCDSQFISNQCRDTENLISVSGKWKDTVMPCRWNGVEAQIGNYAIFHTDDKFSLEIIDERFLPYGLLQKVKTLTNMRAYFNEAGHLIIDPSHLPGKGFLNLSLDAGALFKSEPFEFKFVFHKV